MSTEAENYNPKFKGWFIPAPIVRLFQDGTLNAKEMALLATIDSLVDTDNGIGCYASNAKLGKLVRVKNPENIRLLIARFKKLGLVRQVSYEKGRKRFLDTTWSPVLRK